MHRNSSIDYQSENRMTAIKGQKHKLALSALCSAATALYLHVPSAKHRSRERHGQMSQSCQTLTDQLDRIHN